MHREIPEAQFDSGRLGAHGELAILRIKEEGVGLKRMRILPRKLLQAHRRLRFEHAMVMQQVEINLFSPARRAYRTIGEKDDISAHNIRTIRGPDMRMQAIANHDIVLDNSKKSLAKLDATAEAKILNDMEVT